MTPSSPPPLYLFSDFALSPSRRVLLREGREVALIPRYFDLLVLLVQRRGQAVHRREIFDAVWSDVVVSDGALSQAVRTLRRALGDDPREPVFIRTVSRHGYRFVFPDVSERPDDGAPPLSTVVGEPRPVVAEADPFLAPMDRLLAPGPLDTEERREAAELLHSLGTAEALARLGDGPRSARARALLRDTRWDVAGSGPVPLLGQPEIPETLAFLLWLRARRTVRVGGAAGPRRPPEAPGPASPAGSSADSCSASVRTRAPPPPSP
jgi:DNA-binding winged helix-turn-helix (wHTH) protein